MRRRWRYLASKLQYHDEGEYHQREKTREDKARDIEDCKFSKLRWDIGIGGDKQFRQEYNFNGPLELNGSYHLKMEESIWLKLDDPDEVDDDFDFFEGDDKIMFGPLFETKNESEEYEYTEAEDGYIERKVILAELEKHHKSKRDDPCIITLSSVGGYAAAFEARRTEIMDAHPSERFSLYSCEIRLLEAVIDLEEGHNELVN